MGGRIWRNKKDDGTKIKLNENKVMWFSFQALLGHPWTMMTETGKYKKWKYLLIGCVTSRFDYFKSKRHSKRILFLSKSDAGASIQMKCALRKLKNRNAMNTLNSKQIPIGMPQINKKFNWNVQKFIRLFVVKTSASGETEKSFFLVSCEIVRFCPVPIILVSKIYLFNCVFH